MSNSQQIKLINQATTDFYKTVAESFSETRQHGWDGWEKVLPYFKDAKTVLDLGCGNCRFEKFLFENNVKVENIDCMDNMEFGNSASRFDDVDRITKSQIDIIEALLEDNLNLKEYDVAVCFGVMHHVPTAELRMKLLEELTKSKIAIVSFWQFANDERIFEKALETTKLAQEKLGIQDLEDGDYFLGWQDRTDAFRFCHNFTDEEVIAITSEFNVVENFKADKLNNYVVLSAK